MSKLLLKLWVFIVDGRSGIRHASCGIMYHRAGKLCSCGSRRTFVDLRDGEVMLVGDQVGLVLHNRTFGAVNLCR